MIMKDRTFGFVLTIGIAFIVLSFFLVLQHKAQVHGDDSELCLKHCNDQKLEDMKQALDIWNAANCSIRDICTPAQLNATCEADDETYNITGFCDKDDKNMGGDVP